MKQNRFPNDCQQSPYVPKYGLAKFRVRVPELFQDYGPQQKNVEYEEETKRNFFVRTLSEGRLLPSIHRFSFVA